MHHVFKILERASAADYSDYDKVVQETSGMGTMWYLDPGLLGDVIWPTLEEVLAGDLANEVNKGRVWMAAWSSESGYLPATYELSVVETGPMWFQELDESTPYVWPSLETVMAEDLAAETQKGRVWMRAWSAEATDSPVEYMTALDETSPMWYQTLDTSTAITWPSLATVMTGDLAAENQKGNVWFQAWTNEAPEAPADYATALDETGPMWFAPSDTLTAV